MKTREELLAEERDYKRRRMSYRGRKVKRTTTQVCERFFAVESLTLKESKASQNSFLIIHFLNVLDGFFLFQVALSH